MTIKYGGYTLFAPTAREQEFLNCYLATEDLRLFGESVAAASNRNDPKSSLPGLAKTGIARPNYPPAPELRVNQLYWPTGAARWSAGLFLADSPTRNALVSQAANSQSSPVLSLEMSDGFSSVSTLMYMLAPRQVTENTETAGGPPNKLWILPLVDVRYWWQYKQTDGLSIGANSTWADLFNALASALGVTLQGTDDVARDYGRPDPVEFSRPYENPAVLLDAACHATGRRLVRQLGGTTKCITWSASETELTDNQTASAMQPWALTAGGFYQQQSIPAEVMVTFPRQDYDDTEPDGQLYQITVDQQAGATGTIKVIHDSAVATFGQSGSEPTNQSRLQRLADKIAADDKLSYKRFDATYAGMRKWNPTGWDDHTSYFLASLENGRRAFQTRIQAAPYNFGVDEMLHQLAGSCYVLTECTEEDPETVYATSAIDSDGEDVDLDEQVGKVVRLDDYVCYQVELAEEDEDSSPDQFTTCLSSGSEVTVLESYDDCEGCVCLELTDCDTGMSTIITYTDLLGLGFEDGDFVRLVGESSVCWEITDVDADCGETPVEVTLQECYDEPYASCEACEAGVLYDLDQDCHNDECGDPDDGDTIVTDLELCDEVGGVVKVDGLCYSVSVSEATETTTMTLDYQGPYDTCDDCTAAGATITQQVVTGIDDTGVHMVEMIFVAGLLVGICEVDSDDVNECE